MYNFFVRFWIWKVCYLLNSLSGDHPFSFFCEICEAMYVNLIQPNNRQVSFQVYDLTIGKAQRLMFFHTQCHSTLMSLVVWFYTYLYDYNNSPWCLCLCWKKKTNDQKTINCVCNYLINFIPCPPPPIPFFCICHDTMLTDQTEKDKKAEGGEGGGEKGTILIILFYINC